MRISITSDQRHAIANMASVAAEQFRKDVELLNQIAENGGTGTMGKHHALKLAEVFTKQERDAREWCHHFMNADIVEIDVPDDDVAVAS